MATTLLAGAQHALWWIASWSPTYPLSSAVLKLFVPDTTRLTWQERMFDTYNPLRYMVRMLYFYGPPSIGAWGGLPFSQICTQLNGRTDRFWRDNSNECFEDLLAKVQQYEVVATSGLVVMLLYTWGVPLLYYVLFHVSPSLSLSGATPPPSSHAANHWPTMTNVSQHRSQWERFYQDGRDTFLHHVMLPAVMRQFEWVQQLLEEQQQQQQQQRRHATAASGRPHRRQMAQPQPHPRRRSRSHSHSHARMEGPQQCFNAADMDTDTGDGGDIDMDSDMDRDVAETEGDDNAVLPPPPRAPATPPVERRDRDTVTMQQRAVYIHNRYRAQPQPHPQTQ